ncbi:HlyD family type I secretion membrane fusion protein [Hoeflea marina]|uniref:Membrane fusion protein (MFP) family protein n=1 Tax=Hoeflea marina TaxID=274592 RepID=A0A317PTZ2_9HYPH|nr:HlyD family type I secretion membrane fusion protein [Hoeflea marina]
MAITIITMFAAALAWAMIGKIDVVAIAVGRVDPVGGTKVVQALEIGNVVAIHVVNGQHVTAGQLLVELDATDSEVDIDQLQRQRDDSRLELIRMKAFVEAVAGRPFDFQPVVSGGARLLVDIHRSRLGADVAFYRSQLEALNAEIARRSSEIATDRAEIAKLEELRPLVDEREATTRILMAQGHTSKSTWQQIKAQVIEIKHALILQQLQVTAAEGNLRAATRQLAGLSAQTLQKAYTDLSEAQRRLDQTDLALRKALKREEVTKLAAPVSGTVYGINVNTIGGVVRPAEPLLRIVPDGARLEVKAQILNRDKGVIYSGQTAEIKFDAFDFTRYGTILGEVTSISEDAVEKEGLGLVYDTVIALRKSGFRVDGKQVSIAPGMMARVEIKIGRRRIIDYLLSPLNRYQDEAIRER